MPWLAAQKQGLSAATGSAALRADAAQSSLCAYLSLVALLGLLINALWHVPWADPSCSLSPNAADIVGRQPDDTWKSLRLLLER